MDEASRAGLSNANIVSNHLRRRDGQLERIIDVLPKPGAQTADVVEAGLGPQSEILQPHESAEWLRQLLGTSVSSEVLRPFQYKGRVIDSPEMIISQAKAHFYSQYETQHEDFTPVPGHTAFDLESYLDHLILSGVYQGRVSLKDILEVRGMLDAQRMMRDRESMEKGTCADPASIHWIVNGSPALNISAEDQRAVPFKLELDQSLLRRKSYWHRLPSVSYRLPPLHKPATHRGGEGSVTKDAFHYTIKNIRSLEASLNLASQLYWDQHNGNNEQPMVNLKNPGFPILLHRQLDQTQKDLRRYTQLAQELRRAMRIAPRICMHELVECLDMGLSGNNWKGDQSLRFRDDEYTSSNRTELRLLREAETRWLEFIHSPEERRTNPEMTIRDQILVKRLTRMIESRDPTQNAILDDDKWTRLTDVNEGLNRYLSGPVKKVYIDVTEGGGLRKLQSTNLVQYVNIVVKFPGNGGQNG